MWDDEQMTKLYWMLYFNDFISDDTQSYQIEELEKYINNFTILLIIYNDNVETFCVTVASQQQYNHKINLTQHQYIQYYAQLLSQMSVRKQSARAIEISRRLSVKKIVKQHCVDDLACKHCCTCWIVYKKQYQIKYANITTRYQQALKEIQFLKQINKDLNKLVDDYRKKQQKYGDIETMKQKFKQELQAEINAKRAVDDAILEEKMHCLEKEVQQQEKQLKEYKLNYRQSLDKISTLQAELAELKIKFVDSSEQIERLRSENQTIYKKNEDLYEQISKLQQRMDQKTRLIGHLTNSLKFIEDKFILQKNRAHNEEAEKQILSMNLKNKDKYIDQLTRCTEENLKSLNSLQLNNRELKHVVGILDSEVLAGRANEQYLKERLIGTEQRLIMTQGFARYNGQKVQLMKNDLQLLKLTI